jgi:hypothetical protein
MKLLRAAAIAAALLAAATACGKSEAEMQADCQKAITEASTEKNRPEACNDLSDDDYSALLIAHFLDKEGLGDVDEHPEDLLDYTEDGDVDR